MEIRYPNYYRKFRCIAGECPDTCCAGWEIPVDGASEKRYRMALKRGAVHNKDFARKLKKYIRDGRIISEDVTCPFLNYDGLCEMYIELGPEALCHTCARHPRHMEDYGNLHEMVLLLSCPEVARLVLEENDGEFYVRDLPNRQGDMNGIDAELLERLLQMRDLICKITKEEAMPVNRRMAYALAMGHDVQRRIQNGKCSEITEVLEKYGRAGVVELFFEQWKQANGGAGVNDTLMDDLLKEFAGLEPIYRDWSGLMEKVRDQICNTTAHQDLCKEEKATQEDGVKQENLEQSWTNIFEYYIYSFLLSALYDEDVLSKIKMAVCCTILTSQLFHCCRQQDAETELANICYAVARQIENSDENRQNLEYAMKKEAFSSRRIINALLEL